MLLQKQPYNSIKRGKDRQCLVDESGKVMQQQTTTKSSLQLGQALPHHPCQYHSCTLVLIHAHIGLLLLRSQMTVWFTATPSLCYMVCSTQWKACLQNAALSTMPPMPGDHLLTLQSVVMPKVYLFYLSLRKAMDAARFFSLVVSLPLSSTCD